ncbi:MAG TPA: ABC transporter permease [Gemmatimonadaceae bacterium]|nr:ABC transporter permease [Gemmatimonadaceae bacterium]
MSWNPPAIGNLVAQDVRIAVRRFRSEPGFVALAVLTLALGIGFASTVFGLVHSVMFNSVPYVHAAGIVVFEIRNPASPTRGDRRWLTAQEFVEYRSQMSSLAQAIAVSSDEEVLLQRPEGTDRLTGASLSGDAFTFLGVAPIVGRGLTAADALPAARPVFVMSYRLWNRLGADRALLGRTFVLNGVPTTLVGVMRGEFALGGADLWRPVSVETAASESGGRALEMLARLKTGASLHQAESEFRVVAARLAPASPRLYPRHFVVVGMTLADRLSSRLRPMLRLFGGAVALLLLIACANVANMVLARATYREREMAIRSSLGATRSRLIGQLLAESAVLALLSAVAGCMFAYLGLRVFVRLAPDGLIPPESTVVLNGWVLAFALVTAAATILVVGLVPALRLVGRDLTAPLQGSSRSPSSGLRAGRLNAAVVVSAVTLSLVLLTGAGLLARTFTKLQAVDLGMNAKRLQFYQIRFPAGQYRTAQQKQQLLDQIVARVHALPGVVAAAAASAVPLDGGIRTGVAVPGAAPDSTALALVQLAGDNYFSTVGLRVVTGRALTTDDIRSARRVAVVNETLARRYFGGDTPVGKRVELLALRDRRDDQQDDPTFEIVGVVADTRNHGIREAAIPEAFVPASVSAMFGRTILVRTAGDQPTLAATVQRELWAVDPNLAFSRTGSVQQNLARFAYAEPRFNLFIITSFAGVALVLVALGIYGVVAHTVAQQTHDLGVRIALGATGAAVLWMVLRRGLQLVGTGTALGLAASVAVHRLAESQLWGVPSYDPRALAAGAVLMLAVGFVASLVPARRAVRVDPLVALRHE